MTQSNDDIAIRVEHLGKRYRIGQRDGYKTLRESMMGWFRAKPKADGDAPNDFWALKDVNFEVKRGEVVGIIGRNGAGKSTLLKVLSRITEPTNGRIEITGRVGSLLEVGTGFHPELTGRENVFLNGAILGMREGEIRKKFDEIVAFAEIEQFIDTPVKRYSSGMYTRLAFAVAAHLEPEILIVDEVLAVGDAAFQKKCLGKMKDVAGQGRTVLFVSHQMNAVSALCGQAILLSSGVVMAHGKTEAVLTQYMSSADADSEWLRKPGQLENPYFVPERFHVVGADGLSLRGPARNDSEIRVVIDGLVNTQHPALNVGCAVYASNGELLFWTLTTDEPQERWPKLSPGRIRLSVTLPRRFLNQGTYRLEMIVSLHHIEWVVQPGVNAPQITLAIEGGLSDSPYWMAARPGLNAPVLPFEVSVITQS